MLSRPALHDGRVLKRVGVLVAAGVLALPLAGCSGDDTGPDIEPSAAATPSGSGDSTGSGSASA